MYSTVEISENPAEKFSKKVKELDPIFKWQSTITKVIDKKYKWHKKEALEKAKKLSNNFKNFSLKLLKIPIQVDKMSKKGDLENPKIINLDFSTKSVPD